eukprot:2301544-Lingulodinium_polyedra.AAC.1
MVACGPGGPCAGAGELARRRAPPARRPQPPGPVRRARLCVPPAWEARRGACQRGCEAGGAS